MLEKVGKLQRSAFLVAWSYLEGQGIGGSCRSTGGVLDAQEGTEELHRRSFHVVTPLEDRHVLVQVHLIDPPERAQEVPQTRPQALLRIVVDLADAVPVIIACPLPRGMAD